MKNLNSILAYFLPLPAGAQSNLPLIIFALTEIRSRRRPPRTKTWKQIHREVSVSLLENISVIEIVGLCLAFRVSHSLYI